jgi:SAM-dependent MidA family methyltransferase
MDWLDAGLRRGPTSPPLPEEGEPRLVERIRSEIAAGGPITFARFMELALYEPELGYYRTAVERPGWGGDFLTSPDTHPIFGAAIARQLDEVYRRLGSPARFVVREYGPGSGSLGLAVLQALAGEGRLGQVAGSPELARAIRYAPIEINPHRTTELVERLGAAGYARSLELGLAPDAPETGVVVANEFLDALPVHRLVGRSGGIRELLVGWEDGRFVELEGEPSSPALADRLEVEGVRLEEGARGEVCLAIDDWVSETSAGLERGVVLVVDYGFPAADLYSQERAGGTLRAYAGHHVHDDWTVAVGRQDLTAHVDFTALERVAAAAGLVPLGRTSQAEFLVGSGLDELLEAVRSDPGTTIDEWLAIRSAVRRLLDPRALGGFRVALLGRGIEPEPPLRGLVYRFDR